jgi:hypothetical protein
MTWLVWRQHRAQVAWAAGLLAVFAAAIAITGIHMADLYDAAVGDGGGGPRLLDHLFDGYGAIIDTVHLTLLLPVVLGAFVAAPLIAREADLATDALVWTQSVTRRRWLAAKLAAVVGGCVALAAAVSALVTWWSGTPNALGGDRFHGAQFDTQNLTPVAFTLFAVALGLAAGAALRRTLPAVAATVVVYVAVRMAVGVFVRPHWLAPLQRTGGAGPDDRLRSGSWLVKAELLDPSGHAVRGRLELPKSCVSAAPRSIDACMTRGGFRSVITYHPPSHYWPMQFAESGFFVALAAGLLAFAVVWTLRAEP